METNERVRSSADTDELSALAELTRELVRIMGDAGLASIDLRRGDLRIALRAHSAPAPGYTVAPAPAPTPTPPAPVAEPAPSNDGQPAGYLVSSPMIGTYYASPAPGERPFVDMGDRVEAGQTVAIIEAMKIMNEIIAERSGVVTEIYVTNGEAVEYGHPLLRIREE